MIEEQIKKPRVMETPAVSITDKTLPVPPKATGDKPPDAKALGDKPKKEKKWMLWGLIGFTVILLATAVFLFLQIRKPETEEALPSVRETETEEVLPSVEQVETEGVCELKFTVEASPSPSPSVSPSPSPSASPSPSPSVSPSPTPSPPPTCYDECETNADCAGDLICDDVNGTLRCVNYECPEESDCICPGASPSPGASLPPGASPTARGEEPELPEAGVATPAVLGISVGILLVILGLLF